MHYLGLDTAPRLAAFCIFVGALSAPLTYVLAKRLFDEDVASIAGVLAASRPRCCTSARPPPTRST